MLIVVKVTSQAEKLGVCCGWVSCYSAKETLYGVWKSTTSRNVNLQVV
jgi:hypothetical protein